MRRGTLRVRGRSLSGAQRRPAGARPAPRTDLDAEYDRSRRKGGVRVILRGPGKVLHMGEKGFAGTGADFSHDSAVYGHPSRRVDALPCASRRAEALPCASLLRTRPGPLPGQGDPSGVRPAPTRGLRGKVGRERARHPGVPSEHERTFPT